MVLTLTQKFLLSNVLLTSFFLVFTFAVCYDVMRSTSNSSLQLLPSLLIFCIGLFTSSLFKYPAFIFKYLLPIKSGFARKTLAVSIFPLISAAIRSISLVGSGNCAIDKMWFYWRQKRLFFPIRMLGPLAMLFIAGDTIAKIILTDQQTIIKESAALYRLGTWTGALLSILLFFLTLLAMPRLFKKQRINQ